MVIGWIFRLIRDLSGDLGGPARLTLKISRFLAKMSIVFCYNPYL